MPPGTTEAARGVGVNEENVDAHAVLKADHGQTHRRGWLILGAAGVVAAFRLYQCGMLPSETGDIVRHVLYGVAVDQQGVAAAGIPLKVLSGAWSHVAWARFPYSYPPVALAFFALIASISPSVFAAKLALTLIEAGNACLISKLTRSRVLGLLYWASPLSIWWVSREGQFEPLQSFFMLLAIAAAFERQFVSGVALALAASVKVTAGALVPWLAGVIWPRGWRARGLAVLGLAVGLAPAIVSEVMYGGISNVMRYSSLLIYNPYFWNPWADLFTGNTPLQIAANEIASYGLLVTLIALAFRSRNWLPFIAPIAFVVFCKTHTNVQFWYWLLYPLSLFRFRIRAGALR